MKGVGAQGCPRAVLVHGAGDVGGAVCADQADPLDRSSPSSRKKVSTSRSLPGAARTKRPLSWSTTTLRYLWPVGYEILSIPILTNGSKGSWAARPSATTRAMIDPTVRQATCISSTTALFDVCVASQAT